MYQEDDFGKVPKNQKFIKLCKSFIDMFFSHLTIDQYERILSLLPKGKKVLFSKYYRKRYSAETIYNYGPKQVLKDLGIECHNLSDVLESDFLTREKISRLEKDKKGRLKQYIETLRKSYPEGKIENIHISYKLKEEYHNQLNSKEKNNYGNFFDLIDIIISIATINNEATLYTVPSFFSHYLSSFEMEAVFISKSTRKRPSKQEIKLKENSSYPSRQIIFPTDLNNEGFYILQIPAFLKDAFEIDGSTKFYLGLNPKRCTSLYFFRKTPTNRLSLKASGDIQTLSSMPFNLGEDVGITLTESEDTISSVVDRDISIFNEAIEVIDRGSTFYLKLPQMFFKLTDIEMRFYEGKDYFPINSSYLLFYDLLGNLIYMKVLNIHEDYHKNSPFDVILLDEVPDVKSINDLKIDDLHSIQDLESKIKGQAMEKLEYIYDFEVIKELEDLIDLDYVLDQISKENLNENEISDLIAELLEKENNQE